MPVPDQTSPVERGLLHLRGGARLNFGARSVLRTFVGLDADLAPFALGMTDADYPAWTLGLSLGATVGTR
jgi:hypothetical protein